MTFSVKLSTAVFLWSSNKSVLSITKLHPQKKDSILCLYSGINESAALEYIKLPCLLKFSNNIWIIRRVDLFSGKSKAF